VVPPTGVGDPPLPDHHGRWREPDNEAPGNGPDHHGSQHEAEVGVHFDRDGCGVKYQKKIDSKKKYVYALVVLVRCDCMVERRGRGKRKEEKKGEERPFIQPGSKTQSQWGLPIQEIFQDTRSVCGFTNSGIGNRILQYFLNR